MEEFVDKLIDNSFLIAIQINNSEEELKSHSYGFKRKDIMIYSDRVVTLPDDQTKNGNDFLKLIRKIYSFKPFYSISVAVVSNDLYREIFNLSEEELKDYLKDNSRKVCIEEEFGWFIYGSCYLYFRIPKELIIGSFKYDEPSDTISFVSNSNYYMNLSDKDRETFVNAYKELIINEAENEDYDNEYPYENVMELRRKL